MVTATGHGRLDAETRGKARQVWSVSDWQGRRGTAREDKARQAWAGLGAARPGSAWIDWRGRQGKARRRKRRRVWRGRRGRRGVARSCAVGLGAAILAS